VRQSTVAPRFGDDGGYLPEPLLFIFERLMQARESSTTIDMSALFLT